MRLIDYMRARNLDDAAMAACVGGITEHGIRKLKYRERKPSIEVAIRIHEVTAGSVGLRDWAPGAPDDRGARPGRQEPPAFHPSCQPAEPAVGKASS